MRPGEYFSGIAAEKEAGAPATSGTERGAVAPATSSSGMAATDAARFALERRCQIRRVL
jgi:hypothetical protein